MQLPDGLGPPPGYRQVVIIMLFFSEALIFKQFRGELRTRLHRVLKVQATLFVSGARTKNGDWRVRQGC